MGGCGRTCHRSNTMKTASEVVTNLSGLVLLVNDLLLTLLLMLMMLAARVPRSPERLDRCALRVCEATAWSREYGTRVEVASQTALHDRSLASSVPKQYLSST